MRLSIGITRGLAAIALLGLMVLAVLGFRAQEKDMEGLRQSGQDSLHWTTSQGEAELERFLAVLGRFALRAPDVTAKQVNKRFDILWSRVELFRRGSVGQRIKPYDDEFGAIALLYSLLKRHEKAIVNISHDDSAELHHQILAEFTEAGRRLRALSVKVLAGEEGRLGSARDAVRASARLTWVFSMAALGLSLLLIGIMLVETRRYRRMAEESAELAARAEAASRAKSRFLTMMSHELRTPMNGVLGLLALVRQTALNERQVRLIEQAERSGRQMSGLLGDILDFSDLQSETLVIDRDMFELHGLARAVEEMFGPVIQREGVAFTLEIDPDAPRWVVGDLARLRQVLGHVVTFLVDVVGSKDIRLAISGAPNGLAFDIDAAVQGSDQPGWQPEAMFGRGSAHYGDFASDSLGPMIARGLVSLMGGTVTLHRPVAGRATLSISVPLELIDGAADCVRIETESVTVQAVLAGLLRKLAHAVWEPGAAKQKVTAVLMEAGGEEETVRAARMRSEHPAARLVAVGTPRSAELFDAVCPQPVTAEALAAALRAGADERLAAS
ncbi:MAG: histidine kinase dimerization/phospho-acceptor domain-containing protein [Paracoccaceae bacterium]